jgi:hypothetical protein
MPRDTTPRLDILPRTPATALNHSRALINPCPRNRGSSNRELTPERCEELDELLVTDPALGVAPLVWLNAGATSASTEAAKAEVAKLAYLETMGAEDLSVIPPERLRQLATVARRSTPRALRQMDPEHRHPILLAALAAAHTEIVDETVRVFDMMLGATDGNARDQVAKRQLDVLQANLDRLELLDDILDVVLDTDLDDAEVGGAVRGLGPKRLASAVRSEAERPPRDGGHLELMEARFSHVRSFAPQILGALTFAASVAPSEILSAVQLLQRMNAEGRRHVPDDAPVNFIAARWRSYLEAAREAGSGARSSATSRSAGPSAHQARPCRA